MNLNPTFKNLNMKNPEYPHIIKNTNQLSLIGKADTRGYMNAVSFHTPIDLFDRYTSLPQGPSETLLITAPRQQQSSYKQRIDEDLRLTVPAPTDFNPKHKMPVKETGSYIIPMYYPDFTNDRPVADVLNTIITSRNNITFLT